MKHLTYFPIGSRDIAVDVFGYLRPCMLNYRYSMTQNFGIVTALCQESVVFIVCYHFFQSI